MRLTPKSSRDEIGDIERLAGGRLVLQARVRALPQGGGANAALIRLLAKVLDVPRSAVQIATGAASRLKILRIEGDTKTLVVSLGRMSSLR